MHRKIKAFIGVAIISLSVFFMPVSIFMAPNQGTVAHVTSNTVYAQEAENTPADQCGWLNMEWCFAALIEMLFFWPGYYLAKGGGLLLDFFLDYSISSSTYSQGTEFVHRGWGLVRDIANIFFIFVLLYIAIGTILNLSSVNTKKMLVKVIIIALLINFSLFFSKLVIDASNILARAFLGSITVNVVDKNNNPVESDVTQLSVAIVSSFDPQKLISNQDGGPLHQYQMENDSGNINILAITILVYMVAGAILLTLAWTFFLVAFMFLGRIIELWILMITAPIAFISIIVPFKIPRFGHQEWFKNLFARAFVAPVFIFFMYLIIMFLDTDFVASVNLTEDTSIWSILLPILIPFGIIVALVLVAKKVATQMSGEIAGAISKAAGTVAKVGAMAAGGVALGAAGGAMAVGSRTAAAVGRKTFGRAGSHMSKSTRGGRIGRWQRSLGSKMETSSYDWRSSKAGQKIMGRMGRFGKGASWGQDYAKGGHKRRKDEYEKKRQEDREKREENVVAKEQDKLDTLKTHEQRFKSEFGSMLDDLQKETAKARQNKNDEVEKTPEHDAAMVELRKRKKAEEDFKSGRSYMAPDGSTEGPAKVKTGTDARGNDIKTNWKTLQGDIKTQENEIAEKKFNVRQNSADEMEKESFTGLTKNERKIMADRARGGSGVSGTDTDSGNSDD